MTDDVRLHVVTGKGGTGKTTVAAALALALASGGKNVLLCEVEGRQGIAAIFDVAPLPYAERRVAVAPDGGQVVGLAIDAEAALLEYLDMFYRLGRAGKALDRFGVIDFATTIAPGVRDVLLTGKVYEAARRRTEEGFAYNAVVLDAPPTGRIGQVLNVNTEVAGIAKVGPIRNQADSIMRLLRSPRTRVHIVSTLEEMPVQETLDAIGELKKLELAVGNIIVNLAHDSAFSVAERKAIAADKIDSAQVERDLKEGGVKSDEAAISSLLSVARDHVARVNLQSEQRTRLSDVGRPIVTLPYLSDGIDLGALYDFAEDLVESEVF